MMMMIIIIILEFFVDYFLIYHQIGKKCEKYKWRKPTCMSINSQMSLFSPLTIINVTLSHRKDLAVALKQVVVVVPFRIGPELHRDDKRSLALRLTG